MKSKKQKKKKFKNFADMSPADKKERVKYLWD